MKVKIRLFAILREKAKTGEITKEVEPGTTVAELWRLLQQDYPALDVPGVRLLYAVNQSYVGGEYVLQEMDEVVFVPPVSGGSPCLL
ncbi:MAG TPA: molybdopterin converting factor subunit 1 [Candidatus Acidoferrales bacterium]|nr:molybdopterin converting factor subunit 1 [Candidatus Acidoferrales bacterium]